MRIPRLEYFCNLGHDTHMIEGIFIGIAIAVVLGVIFFVSLKKQHGALDKSFEASAQKALGVMLQEIMRTTRAELSSEKKEITEAVARDLKQNTDSFKELAVSLKQEINERQREIRLLEEDRNKKYGQIAQALTDYKSLTEELRGSTEQLKRVLSSNQLRGSWGELQAEKILEAAGMVLGQHYSKQQAIEGHSDLRPDFTLYLPNKMELYVDVKFPLNSLQEAMNSPHKGDQDRYMQQFGTDLKTRIKEASKYILTKDNCVDYIILFVPSESVFEIINKHFSSIIDNSFSQRVILVSPHSFFAVVRTIQESYTHFYYEQNLKEILKHLHDLLGNFERFKTEFSEVGRTLGVAQSKYVQIAETRYKQISRATDKINQYQIDKNEPLLLDANVTQEAEVESTETV